MVAPKGQSLHKGASIQMQYTAICWYLLFSCRCWQLILLLSLDK